MRLKSLELYGFKSFADRTDFSFDAGITALVGPNGSGKSNVVDAVRWILGEQRAKSLRGKEMLDVIFGGAPTRQATGYAEAALTFSNEDGRLPVEFDEVKLARRLYRDGTSEYLINDNTTRLKDIRDLLMDTGVGTSAYSIMEQGRIDSILRANPADRRAIFEEAAGISKFKARRKETIKKLERVDQNLLRLADITEEVQRRLRSLKIQAGKARRFQEYDEALRELRSRVSRHDYYDLKQRIVESETVLQKLRSDREDGAALRDDLESAIQEVEGEMRELRLRIDATRAERSRREADHRAAEERIGMLQRRLEELQEETASMEERLVEIRTLCESQRSEEQGATTEAEQAEESLAQKQRARQELSERAAEIEEEVSGLEEQRGEWTRQLESARGEETRLRNRAIESASELSSLEERCEKLGEEVAQADALKAELVAENEAAREALEKTAQTIRERRELASELAEKLGERRAELTGLDGRLERAGSEIERLDGRREALAESLERLEGVAGGARALVEAAHGGAVELKGVVDVLSNLMEVDDDHVPPLEAALGDRLDGVVVRDDASADAALAYLQEHRLGIATILVADGATGRRVRRVPTEKDEKSAPAEEAFEEPASEQIDEEVVTPAEPVAELTGEAEATSEEPIEVGESSVEEVPLVTPEDEPSPVSAPESRKPKRGIFRKLLSLFGFKKDKKAAAGVESSATPDQHDEVTESRELIETEDVDEDFESEADTQPETASEPAVVETKTSGEIRRPKREARRRAAAKLPGVIGPLVDLVRIDTDYQGLLDYLVGDYLLCEDADSARRVVDSKKKAARAVVVDGTLFPSKFELRGGSAAAGGGRLAQRNELERLEGKLESLRAEREQLVEQKAELTGGIESIDQELREASEGLNEQELDAARLRAESTAIARRLEKHEAETGSRRDQLSDLTARQVKLAEARAEAEEAVGEVQERFEAIEQSLAELAERGQVLLRQRDDVRAELTDLQVEVAQWQEKKQSLARQRQMVTESLRSAEREQSRLQQSLEDGFLRRDDTIEELATLREKLGELAQEIEGEDGTEHLLGRVQELEGELQERRRERTAIGRRLEDLDSDIQTRSLGEREARVRAEDLRERIAEELEIDLEEAIQDYEPEEPQELDLNAMRREIEDLRGKMSRLGPVNLEAIDELEEVEERAKFYEEQQGDLEKSKKSLQDILKKINVESRERFERTFYSVRDHFREIFRKLFGGGRADIILEEGEDLLEAGIEVLAKPPGKEPRTLELLSGGERTMTAVALLFALFKFRPSPFCILDEVDAALDEANIDRFLGMLEGFLDESQFLIITHSKRTMTAADILYGITMEEAGVSKRIAIKFEDIEDIRVA